ncbi:unnamed protein product, partial [Rotaria sp. Silwood1]
STVYNIVIRCEFGLSVEGRPGAGRPTYFDRKNLKRMQYAAANSVGVSQRKLATKFGVAQITIHYNLQKICLKYYKRQNAPKCTEKQLR